MSDRSRPSNRPSRCCALLLLTALASAGAARGERPHPILFVTQVPIPQDFTTIGSVFGNHRAGMQSAGRGGDLWILYPDGTLRNLTQLAGYGVASGFQGAGAIAVREPAVHWSGTKAIFSMVVGAPTAQFDYGEHHWQLYEIEGLGPTDTPVVTKVPNQPEDYDNVSPAYASDGEILFTSDRPRDGQAHMHPQRDEYEEAPTVSGLWRLDPASGALTLLDHAPSGVFRPFVDSYGRVVFTRWDHLQRDQQADADDLDPNGDPYGTFDWSSEKPDSIALAQRVEVFPEPRSVRTDLLMPYEEGHSFNHFFPWMANQDGTGLETLNHVGRHELHSYFNRAFNDDPNLDEFIAAVSGRANPNSILNFLQVRESASVAGRYLGVDAPEFQTHAAGQVVAMDVAPSLPADQIVVAYRTHPDTSDPDPSPGPCHSGFYRSPLQLADGSLIAVHAGENGQGDPETRADANTGTRALPGSRYSFRLRDLGDDAAPCEGYLRYGAPITPGIHKTLWFWDPDVRVDYVDVVLWELDPVEVRARPAPPAPTGELPAPEAAVFAAEAVDVAAFRADLAAKGLALVVSRDVTTRDAADEQQPYNLRVPGGTAQTLGAAGRIYDVEYLQLFQADLLRGLFGPQDPAPGRRVLARPMHDPRAVNPPLDPGDPPSSVEIAADGSMAALVPAHRAMSWQLTAGDGTPVVRERYWLTFQAGEIRVCASCHGVNSLDQAGQSEPQNPPQALQRLLQWWKGHIFTARHEEGDLLEWGSAVGAP